MIIRNSVANIVGNLVYPILSIIFIPVYIHYLGLEGYGFIGFFSILVSLLGILTNGLGVAFQREIARRDSSRESRRTLRQLVRTFELTYWAIGVVLALCLVALSGKISTDWVKVESIPMETIRLCTILVSLRIALTFPNSIYQSVFLGTQQQVINNILKSITAIIGSLSGVAVVIIWKSILGFCAVDLINSVWTIFLLRYWSGKLLPPKNESLKSNFELAEFRNLLSFSLGLIWANGIGVVVSQTDRIIISKLLTMATLGVYNVAIAVSMPLNVICISFFAAFYPQICQTSKEEDCSEKLSFQLIYAAKIVMIICMMFGLPLFFFSSDLIEAWTTNDTLVAEGSHVVSFYIIGTIFMSYASVLYLGQNALGITRFGVLYGTIALLLFPLTEWALVNNLGLIGAALGWLIYGSLGWIFHVVSIRLVLKDYFPVDNYLRLIMLTSIIGISTNCISRYLSLVYFPELILGRILIASLGGIATSLVCYGICFGFQIPKDFENNIISIYRSIINKY